MNKLWIEHESKKFKEDIDKALKSSTKTYTKSLRVEKPTYWTQEIDVLRRKMRKHYRVARQTNREQDWTYYRGLRRVFRGEVEKAKVESWRKHATACSIRDTADPRVQAKLQ